MANLQTTSVTGSLTATTTVSGATALFTEMTASDCYISDNLGIGISNPQSRLQISSPNAYILMQETSSLAITPPSGYGAFWSSTTNKPYYTNDAGDNLNMAEAGGSSVLMMPGFSTANLTSTKTPTTNVTYALYMGKCPEYKTSTSNFTVRYRVTSVAATITWAEVAIATGGFVLGGPSLLSTIAYTNISGTLLSTGQKSTTISMLSATSPIVPGNDIWVLFGVNATTTGIYRAASIADDLQSGVQLVSAAGIRPSTMSTGTSFSVEGATILPMWISLRV